VLKLREARPEVLRPRSVLAALAFRKPATKPGCLFQSSSLFLWKAKISPNKHSLSQLQFLPEKHDIRLKYNEGISRPRKSDSEFFFLIRLPSILPQNQI
jgi:hypothetical protein